MAKRRKRSSTSSHSSPDARSSNAPRLDPQERLLSRFYEPLVLLYTLGRTRGEHTGARRSSQEHLASLSLNELRRVFLSELAYMCDYDKGGETVASLGVQATPQGPVYWVASNAGAKQKVLGFLETLLAKLAHSTTAPPAEDCVSEIVAFCIDFAKPRIKKYRSLLRPLLRRCMAHLTDTPQADSSGLIEWLRSWEPVEAPFEICHLAYTRRDSDPMHTLARLGTESTYRSNSDSIRSAFRLVRHYIGRLGHHFRATKALIHCAPQLLDLLHDFQVRGVPALPETTIPAPDHKTTLASVLVRMLPANSPDLPRHQQALADMDARHEIFKHFLQNYTAPDLKPRVHAEIQVLEHFYAQGPGFRFAGDDAFIACSKPACFCCLLYFRNHPGHFVEPASHNKIYLNWRPPGVAGSVGPTHLRDILNGVTKEIRREALRQVEEKSAPSAWHPDSVTGITCSRRGAVQGRDDEGVDGVGRMLEGMTVLGDLGEDLMGLEDADMSLGRGEGEVAPLDEASSSSLGDAALCDFLSDSDDGGGVPL